jgi:hypothetical protein
MIPRTHRSIERTALLLSLFFVSAAGAQQTTGWPDWLMAAMAREANNLQSTAVSAENGRYRFQVPGNATPAAATRNGWQFATDISAETPLECHVVTDGSGLAELAYSLAESSIQAHAKTIGGPVDNRSIHSIDAGVIAGTPFLALEWIYTIGKAPNALLGFTKVRVAANDDIVQACSHNLLGYKETFNNVFAAFVRSAQLPKMTVQPYYEEISVHSLGDQRVGVSRARFALDAAGDSRISINLSSLIPVAPDTLSYEDSSTISSSTPDGLLINAHASNSQDGELVADLQLNLTDQGSWLLRGKYKGKGIEQRIAGTPRPVSELGQLQAAHALFAGDSTEVTFPIWQADIDPTVLLEAKIVRDDADVVGLGTLTIGPMAFTAQFDEFGAIARAVMSAGSAEILTERVWSRGQPQ